MDDIRFWLALQHVPGLGPAGCRALLTRYGNPPKVFEAVAADEELQRALAPGTLDGLLRPDWKAVERDLAWLDHADHHALTLHHPRYPALLREIHDAPPVLYCRGDPRVLGAHQLAIVGSRNPSAGGADTAHDFAAELCRHGIAVTSGLALGIDAAAHRGALAAAGVTVAVAATGLDRVYPARHRALADDIARTGAIVSEFAPGRPPLPEAFPRRNRIISGLSLGTLVVEAALGSGSLITARAALEQGREVFAIPGSIHNPCARGCHALIRQGAKLVERIGDILEELGELAQAALALDTTPTGERPPGVELEGTTAAVLRQIDYAPTGIDALVERTGQSPERLHRILLDLELANLITSAPGGAYLRRRPRD